MQSNRLQINSHKTGLLWYATTRRQYQLPRSPLLVDGTPINPVQSVRDLGIFIDADLVMRTHVHKTVSRCLAILRQLRSIRHLVPATTFQTLIVSLVLSRLDCRNAVLAFLPAYLFRRLRSVMNAVARLIYGLRHSHSDNISDALIILHWLRARERIRFKTAVLMYKATHGTAPSYLSQLVRVADLPGRRSLRSARPRPVSV